MLWSMPSQVASPVSARSSPAFATGAGGAAGACGRVNPSTRTIAEASRAAARAQSAGRVCGGLRTLPDRFRSRGIAAIFFRLTTGERRGRGISGFEAPARRRRRKWSDLPRRNLATQVGPWWENRSPADWPDGDLQAGVTMTATGVRDLYLVTSARAISTIGNEVAVIALLLRLHDAGAGGWAVAGLLIAGTLPLVVLAPVAGALADHYDSRTVLVAGGLAQAAVCTVLAFTYQPLAVLTLVALNASGSAVAGPTFTALVPALVPRDRLAMAIGLQEGAQSVAILAGPALGGLLTGLSGGATLPLLLDAATFAALAAAGGALRTRRTPAEGANRRMFAGIALLATDPVVRAVTGLLTVLVLVGEGVTVAEVFLVRDTFGGSATAFGVLTTTFTAGMLAGTLPAAALKTLRQTLIA